MSLWLTWAKYPEVVSRRVNKRGREKEKKEKEEGGGEEEGGEKEKQGQVHGSNGKEGKSGDPGHPTFTQMESHA